MVNISLKFTGFHACPVVNAGFLNHQHYDVFLNWVFEPPEDPGVPDVDSMDGRFFLELEVFHVGVEPKKSWILPPKWMVKIMENCRKMDDLGGFPPIFGNTHVTNADDYQPMSCTKQFKFETCTITK